eukprot:TRINITY_DN4351_c0_g3_i2.p1 TRINITY_DN4351_c0_g3~~TRINITY_DN4351_c0_g3_i2.p1  ORF type:complete len:172 (-),score=99.42 TRINITY_DN4351_c0_g3_i2:137-652(-)
MQRWWSTCLVAGVLSGVIAHRFGDDDVSVDVRGKPRGLVEYAKADPEEEAPADGEGKKEAEEKKEDEEKKDEKTDEKKDGDKKDEKKEEKKEKTDEKKEASDKKAEKKAEKAEEKKEEGDFDKAKAAADKAAADAMAEPKMTTQAPIEVKEVKTPPAKVKVSKKDAAAQLP